MEYAQQPRNTVTMIDELPELSDIERSQGHGYHQMPSQGHPQDPVGHQQFQPGRQQSQPGYQRIDGIMSQEMANKYKNAIRQSHQMHPGAGMESIHAPEPEYEQHQYIPAPRQQFNALHDITCLHIANHIYDCPICSKFYNNDKTVYIICIVVLSIICIMLLKRVLDV